MKLFDNLDRVFLNNFKIDLILLNRAFKDVKDGLSRNLLVYEK